MDNLKFDNQKNWSVTREDSISKDDSDLKRGDFNNNSEINDNNDNNDINDNNDNNDNDNNENNSRSSFYNNGINTPSKNTKSLKQQTNIKHIGMQISIITF